MHACYPKMQIKGLTWAVNTGQIEEAMDIKSECIVVSAIAMVHLYTPWMKFSLTNNNGKWCYRPNSYLLAFLSKVLKQPIKFLYNSI